MSTHSTMKGLGRAAEFLAWTAFFVCAALVLALRYWVLPDIERFREPIVAAVSQAVGLPVRIGGMEASWNGLLPRLHLTEVRIYDREGREALVLPSVRNVLAWRSLLTRKLELHTLAIEGLRVQVRRDLDGALWIAGMKLAGEGGGGFGDWLLAQEEVVLRDAQITWHDEKRGAPPLVLSALNLRLRNSGDEHSLGFSARPPAELGSPLELRAELQGASFSDLAWSGRVYAELGATDLAAWSPWVDYPRRLSRGQGALRLWVALERGEAKQATADVELSGVSASLGEDLAPLQLASLSGRLTGRALEGGYELAGQGIVLELEEAEPTALGDFRLRWQSEGGETAAAAMELEPLSRLAAALPFPAEARRFLAELAPRGRLANARLEWRGPAQAPERFAASGSFERLGAAPAGKRPGFAGLSGRFKATQAGGHLHLDARGGALNLPAVFPESLLPLDTLNGEIEWERGTGRAFTVRVSALQVANAHFSGRLSGSYAYAGEGPGVADLSGQLDRADARYLARYLPHARYIGGQKTRHWLVDSIRAGQSNDVRLRLRGDLREFPFRDARRGEFRVAIAVEHGVLDYADRWPRIEDIRGSLVFERDGMEITKAAGTLLGVPLSEVVVRLPHLDGPDPQLEITGRAEGPSASFLDFIAESPVREMAKGMTDELQARGSGRLQLRLQLPLDHLDDTRVAGEYRLAENTLLVSRDLPVIERASGTVRFTESSLTIAELRGRLFGGAITMNGGTREGGALHLMAQGEATVAGARPFFDHPLGRYFSGAAPYTVSVDVDKTRRRVSFESTLRGVASSLPAPFAKQADQSLPLRVDIVPQDAGRDRLSVAIGTVLRAELGRRREGERMVMERGAIVLTPAAQAAPRLPDAPGVRVTGTLSAIDLDAWRAIFPAGGDAAASAGAQIPISLDVRAGVLDVYGKRVNQLSAQGSIDSSGTRLRLAARELAGEVTYGEANGGRLFARLAHFRVPDDAPGAQAGEPISPHRLPAMDAIAERVVWRGHELGRVEILASHAGDDWLVERLAMTNPDATLYGKGAWRAGAPSRSALDFALQAHDAGAFLDRIGYPGLVKGGSALLQGNLTWSGEPVSLDYPSLTGTVQLQADNGEFLEIEPGFGKLISLMSLQALPRRITFDFRDVFAKGFAFERIRASGRIDAGVLALNDFNMSGSSARVEMTGRVDLARETQELQVRVVPSLGDSASTVIALAINPLLAIPAAIAQKILKDPLGHIFAFNYAVSGSWTDPKVEKKGVEAKTAENMGQ